MMMNVAELAERSATSESLEHIEEVKALILSEGAEKCAAAATGARAVVLTGSMSRGEATIKSEGAGWRMLGDATFLIVSDRALEIHLTGLEQEIGQTLLRRGIQAKVVVVTSTTEELRKLKPHIYAYELRERGIVVWGDKDALRLIPAFRATEIPKEDGWWLLCNRMIEQLEAAATTESVSSRAVEYRIAKLYLAMAGCYLLAIEQYDPSYHERAARLEKLANSADPPPSPVPLKRFSERVSQCTELKLRGRATGVSTDFPCWRDAVLDAEPLWRWVLSRILGLDRKLDRACLLAELASRQRISARAKGWVRNAYVHPELFRKNWLRWMGLAVSSSPRYLIYGTASELFFSAPEPDMLPPDQLKDIVSRLPLPAEDQHRNWYAAARLVAHNFHLLLESTRS